MVQWGTSEDLSIFEENLRKSWENLKRKKEKYSCPASHVIAIEKAKGEVLDMYS